MDHTSIEDFDQEVDELQQRADELEQSVSNELDRQPAAVEMLPQALSTAVEELHVSIEELRQQNQELAAARQTVEEERRRYQELFEFAPDGYLVTDLEGVVQEANRTAINLLNAPRDRLVGKPLSVFVYPEELGAFHRHLNRLHKGQAPTENWEVRLQPRNKKPRHATISISIVRDSDGEPRGLRWLVRDVTERKRLEKTSRWLMETQETERRQVAYELQEEIAQVLAAVKMALDMAVDTPSATNTPPLGEAQKLTGGLIRRLRELSAELRPSVLDHLGLLPALEWLFQQYTERTQVRVNSDHCQVAGKRFPPAVETAVYRIAQEGLANVAQHAGVEEVTVELWTHEDKLYLTIADEGVGFDTAAVLRQPDASALAAMQGRAILSGGHLTVESTPGEGTQLTVEWPI